MTSVSFMDWISQSPFQFRDIIRAMQTFDILWQGNPLSLVKSFGTRECQLCSREKIEIIKWSRKEPETLINTCSEIYGGCRHKPKFHRYREEVKTNSADEHIERERVNLSSNNSTSSGAGTVEKENQPSFCEATKHSFCQVILQDVSDVNGSSPNRLSQPLNICSTVTI